MCQQQEVMCQQQEVMCQQQEVMCQQQEFHAAVILKLRRLYGYEAVNNFSEVVI